MHTNVNVKHIFFVAIIFIISLCNGHAQSDNSSNCSLKKEIFTFGPKISVNIAKNEISSFPNKFLPGTDFGLFFRISPTRFYIQPEINYHIRNKEIYQDEFNTTTVKFKAHHIDIPILFGIKVIDLKVFKVRFFAGPEFNVRLKDSSIDRNNYQLGLQAGLGFDLWRFTVDASYSFLGYLDAHQKRQSHVFKVGVGFKCY